MNKTHPQKQKLEALTRSRWFYVLAVIAVAILLLSFLPGGSNLRIFLVPIVGWTSFIWMIRRYGFGHILKAILVGFATVIALMLLFL
jgi:hypothetical protein